MTASPREKKNNFYFKYKVFFFLTTMCIYYCDDNVIHFLNENTNKARAMRALAFSAAVKTE